MKAKEVKGRQREMADAIARAEQEEALEEGRSYTRPRPPRDPAQVYSVRIPTGDLAELRAMAEYQGVTPSALIRQLVVDHLASMRKFHEDPDREISNTIVTLESTVGTLKKMLSEAGRQQEKLL
jgi:hypothetical protein